MSGKGDTPRAVNGEVFRRNYDGIFMTKPKQYPDWICNQCGRLEEALRNIANGDMRTSRAKAKMALEGTFPPVDENPEQAERINKLEEQPNVMRFLFNQAAKELESEQQRAKAFLRTVGKWEEGE